MKIIVALQNNEMKEKLQEKYMDQVYIYDIDNKENLIEFLASKEEEYIIITKENLPGTLNEKMYIKQLRLASPRSKIIYLVKKLDESYKEFLFANHVFNIIEGNSVNIEQLIDMIENDNKIVYKSVEQDLSNLKERSVIYSVENQIIPKQVIAIYGTSGAGKSCVSSLIAKNLSKKLNITISLLDMDIQNPAIDLINDIDGNNHMLSQLVDDVDKRQDINHIISSYLMKDKKYPNLSYLTNNCSIFDCQNRLSNRYYEKIYHSVQSLFDFTIIDLPSSPFLDIVPYTLSIATKIFFVINPNYISIRQAVKYLDLLTKLWDIPQEKIYLIVNKISHESLDMTQINSLLSDYETITSIPYDKNIEACINGINVLEAMKLPMDKILECLHIKEKEAILKKMMSMNFISKIGSVKRDN